MTDRTAGSRPPATHRWTTPEGRNRPGPRAVSAESYRAAPLSALSQMSPNKSRHERIRQRAQLVRSVGGVKLRAERPATGGPGPASTVPVMMLRRNKSTGCPLR